MNGTDRAGAASVLYGSSGGLADTGNQLWHQDSPGITGEPEEGDHFGDALAYLPTENHPIDLPVTGKAP